MYQRDYILRLIEQMTSMMAAVAGLRKQHKQEQAFELVDELLGRFYRLNTKLLNSLSEKDLVAMLSVNGFLETEKVLLLAGLMKEEGELYDSLDRPTEAYSRYLKALQLALAVSEQEENNVTRACRDRVEELADKLYGYRLPFEAGRRLYEHYGRAGLYAKAEDTLFRLLNEAADASEPGNAESKGRVEELLRSGIRFYELLLQRTDAELERGNLPREEVEETLAELHRRA